MRNFLQWLRIELKSIWAALYDGYFLYWKNRHVRANVNIAARFELSKMRWLLNHPKKEKVIVMNPKKFRRWCEDNYKDEEFPLVTSIP